MSFLDKLKGLVSGKAPVVKDKVEEVKHTLVETDVHPTADSEYANPDEFPKEEVK
jgi:hypothetical protein